MREKENLWWLRTPQAPHYARSSQLSLESPIIAFKVCTIGRMRIAGELTLRPFQALGILEKVFGSDNFMGTNTKFLTNAC